jgi:hypothetical protein
MCPRDEAAIFATDEGSHSYSLRSGRPLASRGIPNPVRPFWQASSARLRMRLSKSVPWVGPVSQSRRYQRWLFGLEWKG